MRKLTVSRKFLNNKKKYYITLNTLKTRVRKCTHMCAHVHAHELIFALGNLQIAKFAHALVLTWKKTLC